MSTGLPRPHLARSAHRGRIKLLRGYVSKSSAALNPLTITQLACELSMRGRTAIYSRIALYIPSYINPFQPAAPKLEAEVGKLTLMRGVKISIMTGAQERAWLQQFPAARVAPSRPRLPKPLNGFWVVWKSCTREGHNSKLPYSG